MNAINKLSQPYKTAEQQKAAEVANAKAEAIGEIATLGKGSFTFADVDQFLTDNPDVDYFRIENKSAITTPKREAHQNGLHQSLFGPSLDLTQASIVSQDSEKSSLDRYANISNFQRRTDDYADIPVDLRYKPSSFFSGTDFQYDPNDGLIFSREEYGVLKNIAASRGKKDGFLLSQDKSPELPSDQLEDANNTDNTDRQEFRGLGTDEESDTLSGQTKAKRTLLG